MSISDHAWFRVHPVHERNIGWHWDNATDDEIHQGLHWYVHAHHVAKAIANGDARLGAGMLAVYSPQQAWNANLLLAATVLRTRVGIGGAGSGVFATATQRTAAERLLAGERWDTVLSGPKVRAFADLIEHGGNQAAGPSRVVIDRHALSVAHGAMLTTAEYTAAPVSAARRRHGLVQYPYYDRLVELYRDAAAEISCRRQEPVAPHEVQAVTWLVRQRLTQAARTERGLSVLDKGRDTARANAEQSWDRFRTTHFPHIGHAPRTGYQPAA